MVNIRKMMLTCVAALAVAALYGSTFGVSLSHVADTGSASTQDMHW